MRLAATCVVAIAATLLLLLSSGRASAEQSPDLLALTSNVTYDVKATDATVHITWDVTVTDNDPETSLSGSGQTFYYSGARLPVLIGASNIVATDTSGRLLDVTLENVDQAIVQSANVTFGRGLFFGQSYALHLTYDLADARSQAIIVTPYYAYVPIVAVGNPANVTVNTPSGDPWQVTVEAQDCQGNGSAFTCSGSPDPYLAAIAEVSQPTRTATTNFVVPLADKSLTINLTYFEGETLTSQHQQALITAALPVIEETFGFDYAGPELLNVSQGGQQAVLGYEGLTSCGADKCDIVISPVANDYTVIHELSHLWTPIYSKRWLQEGFAQLLAETVGPMLPAGVVNGAPPQRPHVSTAFQLDGWGETSSLLSADPAKVATEDAGYDYSLRFLEQLRDQFGMQALKAVNRNIATSGKPADSRHFMDLMEEATGRSMDNLFLVWVFPDSYGQVLADRREARDRLAALQQRLSDEGLPNDVVTPIQTSIDQWSFTEALAALDQADAGLQTYADLLPKLSTLKTSADAAGLALPDSIATALNHFDFETARNEITSASDAVTAYGAADAKVHEGRDVWTTFGLLGSSPGGSLSDAKQSFANGAFDVSREQSQHAQHLVEDASSVAFKRLLIVAGFLGVLALAVGIAIAVGRFRERQLAEP